MSSLFRQALHPIDSVVALEGQVDGKISREREHMWFAYFPQMHPDFLGQATSWEAQSQWEIKIDQTDKNAAKGKLRCREVRQGGESFMKLGEPEYISTTKVKRSEGDDESEIVSTYDTFLMFQHLSDQGMIKDRYHFPVPGSDRVFEVDMFLLPGLADMRLKGGRNRGPDYHPWCKIDFEVKDFSEPIPPFPFTPQRIISGIKEERSPEEEKIVDMLFKDCFLTPNLFLKK